MITLCLSPTESNAATPLNEKTVRLYQSFSFNKDGQKEKNTVSTEQQAASADASISPIRIDKIKIKPYDNPSILYKKAQAQYAKNNYKDGLKIVEQLIKTYPNNTDYQLLKANILFAAGKSKKQIQTLLTRAIKLTPNYRALYKSFLNTCHSYGNTYSGSPSLKTSDQLLSGLSRPVFQCHTVRQVAAAKFSDEFWWYRNAPKVTAEGRVDRSWLNKEVYHLNKFVDSHPKNHDAQLLLAKRLVWQESFKEALAHLSQLVLNNPDNTDYKLVRSWAQTIAAGHLLENNNTDDTAEAFYLLSQAYQATPKRHQTARLLMQVCQQSAGLWSSCNFYRKKIDANFQKPYWSVSYQAKLNKDGSLNRDWYADRIQRLNMAIEKAPKDIGLLETRARLLNWQNQTEKAIADYTVLMQLRPQHTNYAVVRAKLYNRLKQPEKAQKTITPYVKSRTESAPQSVSFKNTGSYGFQADQQGRLLAWLDKPANVSQAPYNMGRLTYGNIDAELSLLSLNLEPLTIEGFQALLKKETAIGNQPFIRLKLSPYLNNLLVPTVKSPQAVLSDSTFPDGTLYEWFSLKQAGRSGDQYSRYEFPSESDTGCAFFGQRHFPLTKASKKYWASCHLLGSLLNQNDLNNALNLATNRLF
ncbi:MAG: tetratricopeptide repeat protein [Cyanobacteria bacterium P01_H01_bin.74]